LTRTRESLLRPSAERRGERTGQRGQQEAAAVHAGTVGCLACQPASRHAHPNFRISASAFSSQYVMPRSPDITRSQGRIGIVNVNVEPASTWLSTQILPPCSSMNFRDRARPSPVPSTFLAAVPTCRNSSKIAS
jgi:hypothetical protein